MIPRVLCIGGMLEYGGRAAEDRSYKRAESFGRLTSGVNQPRAPVRCRSELITVIDVLLIGHGAPEKVLELSNSESRILVSCALASQLKSFELKNQ